MLRVGLEYEWCDMARSTEQWFFFLAVTNNVLLNVVSCSIH